MSGTGEGYNIPIGIDLGQSLKGLDELIDKATKAKEGAIEANKAYNNLNDSIAQGAAKANDALKKEGASTIENKKQVDAMGKAINDAFDTKGQETFNKKTKEAQSEVAKLREEARLAGKAIADAISGKTSMDGLEENIKKFQDLLRAINGQNASLGFSVDDKALEDFQNKLMATGGEIKQLAFVVAYAKEQLARMAPDSDEFAALNAQIQLAEGFLDGLGTTVDQLTNSNTNLKKELKEIKDAMEQLQAAGLEDSDQFEELSKKAAELQDKISSVSERVKTLASDTSYLEAAIQAMQGLVAVYTAAQAAAALFGDENEEAEKVIKKVTAAMAVLQSIQAAAEVLNKNSAFSLLILNRVRAAGAAIINVNVASIARMSVAQIANAVATKIAAAATWLWNAALAVNPIVWITTAIIAAVGAIYEFATAGDKATETTEDFNKALERSQELLALDKNALERGTAFRIAYAKSIGKAESEISKIQQESYEDERKLLDRRFVELQSDADRTKKLYEDGLIDKEDYKQRNEAIDKEATTLKQRYLDLNNDIEIKSLEIGSQRKKEALEAEKKRLQELKRQEEERRKALEAERKRNEQLLKLQRDLHNVQLSIMENGRAKEKQSIELSYRDRVQEIKNIQALTPQAEKAKKELLSALALQRGAELLAVDARYNEQFKKQELDTQSELAGLMKDGLDKSLEILRTGLAERLSEFDSMQRELEKKQEKLSKQFFNASDPKLLESLNKDLAATQAALENTGKLREATIRNGNEEEAKIRREFALKQIDDQEALDKATTELYKIDVANKAEYTRYREKEILKITIQAAEERIKILSALDDTESKTRVAQLKKVIADAKKELDEVDKNNPKDLFAFLGINDKTKGKIMDFSDALSKTGEIASSVFSSISEGITSQINAKQKQIDEYGKQIDRLSEELDREKELQKNGYANNVAQKEQELATAKDQQARMIKQQEELQKKQQAMQKAQIIADSFAQTNNLITASTEIFKTFSKIPFIGQALAIGAIATMFGAFAKAKVNAYNAVSSGANNIPKLEKGGGFLLKGPSHSSGGLGVYDERTGNRVAEVEGGEGFFATNKKSTQKHLGLLNAINNDDFGQFHTYMDSMRQILLESGITFPHEDMANTVSAAHHANAQEARYKAAMIGLNNEALKKIAESNEKMLDLEKEKEQVIDLPDRKIIKKGNYTRIIKKKNG